MEAECGPTSPLLWAGPAPDRSVGDGALSCCPFELDRSHFAGVKVAKVADLVAKVADLAHLSRAQTG